MFGQKWPAHPSVEPDAPLFSGQALFGVDASGLLAMAPCEGEGFAAS